MLKRLVLYIVLFLMIFTLGNSLIFGLSIGNTVTSITNNIYASFDTVATIHSEPFEKYYQYFDEYKDIVENLANEEEVKFASINYFLQNVQIPTAVGRSKQEGNSCKEYCSYNYDELGNKKPLYLDLMGLNTIEIVDELLGYIELVEGRYFTSDELTNTNVAIIPYDLVDENGNVFEIGDKIVIKNKQYQPDDLKRAISSKNIIEPSYELEIIGKYKVLDEEYTYPPYSYSDRIYVSNKLVEQFSNAVVDTYEEALEVDNLLENDKYYVSYFLKEPYFKLNSFEEANIFKEKVNSLFSKIPEIKDYYQCIVTNETIERILEPIQSIEKMIDTIKYGSFISLGIIILLIILLFINNSNHEIAIYYALGLDKIKIIMKFCQKILLITFISLICIRISAPVISTYLSDKTLELIVVEEKDIENNNNISSTQLILDPNLVENKDILKDFKVEITNSEYLICSIYVIVINSLGCIFMIIKILKTNVKELLM